MSPEWLHFSKFKEWCIANEKFGDYLDKDLLGDSKVYGPSTCLMVSRLVNNLFTLRANARGGLPLGVCKNPNTSKYGVYVNKYGKKVYVGAYTTVDEAKNAYLAAKKEYVIEIANSVVCPKTKQALLNKHIV